MKFGLVGLLALALLLCNFHSSSQIQKPRIEKVGRSHRLEIPSTMRDALRSYDSTFTIWSDSDYLPSIRKTFRYTARTAPFAVIGDFNGDRKTDLAIQGHTKRNELVVALISRDTSYKLIELDRGGYLHHPQQETYDMGSYTERGLWSYLNLLPAGTRLSSEGEPQPVNLRNAGIVLVYFEKSSTYFYFSDDRFVKYEGSD